MAEYYNHSGICSPLPMSFVYKCVWNTEYMLYFFWYTCVKNCLTCCKQGPYLVYFINRICSNIDSRSWVQFYYIVQFGFNVSVITHNWGVNYSLYFIHTADLIWLIKPSDWYDTMVWIAWLKFPVWWCFENPNTLMDKAVDEMEFASISTPTEAAMWSTYRSRFHSDNPYSFVCIVFIQLEKNVLFCFFVNSGCTTIMHRCCCNKFTLLEMVFFNIYLCLLFSFDTD